MYKRLNFIIDKITGFNIQSELDKVIDMDGWSREDILRDQKNKFKILSGFAVNSEYYKGFEYKDLPDYPIMKREDYHKNSERLKTNKVKPYRIQYSSGSVSYPNTHYVTKEMLLAKRVAHQKMLKWFGLFRESPELKIGGIKEDLITKIYYKLRNKRFINSFHISAENIDDIIRGYNRFKPSLLYGYPSSISHLIQLAEIRGYKLHQPVIITTQAENLYAEHKEKFTDTFPGTKIVNQYWSTEANIGVTCPAGSLHLDEDTVICEVINKDEKGVGDLVVTNLYSYALPIIRYKIGDRVKLSETLCSCGRKTRIIENLEGRESEYLDLPDHRRIPITNIYISRYAENLMAFRIIYFKNQGLIEFQYLPFDQEKPINKQGIEGHFKNDFGLTTRFVMMDKIHYTQGGKYKRFQIVD